MSILLDKETRVLEKHLLELSALVEASVHKSVKAVEDRDAALAREVIDADTEIDRREVDIEEECLKVLALYQPVAIDLRFIVVLMKINNDLERVGDCASTIAKRALQIAELPEAAVPFDFYTMAESAWTMVRDSVDSLVTTDVNLAESVRLRDREVDEVYRSNYDRAAKAMRRHPEHLDAYISYLTVSRSLERIADHATNIAEDVIYMLQGEIVRHGARKAATGEGA